MEKNKLVSGPSLILDWCKEPSGASGRNGCLAACQRASYRRITEFSTYSDTILKISVLHGYLCKATSNYYLPTRFVNP